MLKNLFNWSSCLILYLEGATYCKCLDTYINTCKQYLYFALITLILSGRKENANPTLNYMSISMLISQNIETSSVKENLTRIYENLLSCHFMNYHNYLYLQIAGLCFALSFRSTIVALPSFLLLISCNDVFILSMCNLFVNHNCIFVSCGVSSRNKRKF